MAYDEALAQRIREGLASRADIVERKMFGGLAFMVRGNVCVGVWHHELIVRVGPAAYDDALDRPHARIMDFTGRPMTGWVLVAPPGVKSARDLKGWIKRGLDHALSLPAK